MPKHLVSTLSGLEYPFERIGELSENGEPLEVHILGLERARIHTGERLWERFSDFIPFTELNAAVSLGEGGTPLLRADEKLRTFTGISGLLLKNETQNPTWSFKDRGSLTCTAMAREMGERVTATISTGNMGHSIAAYGAKASIHVVVFVPRSTPAAKIGPMTLHGATVMRVAAPDYAVMKHRILKLAPRFGLTIVSGNGPIRVEGYKLTAFEMLEQLEGGVPDFIAVPTSACGHIRGLFKGYRELKTAGIVNRVPRMIIVQARRNSPIVSAIKEGKRHVIPFHDAHTVAEAITTGNPRGGEELIQKAREFDWLAEDVSEEEILTSQRRLARSGMFVEPASATSLFAVKKLRESGRIPADASVVLMLTGSGLKDPDVLQHHRLDVVESEIDRVESDLEALLSRIRES
jgi:threonine synthase